MITITWNNKAESIEPGMKLGVVPNSSRIICIPWSTESDP